MAVDDQPTRERIMQSALELFCDRGFDRTSVADIEEASGLSRGSGAFYRHFDTKKELLEAVIDDIVARRDRMESMMEMVSLGDLEAEARLLLDRGLKLMEPGQKLYLTLLPLAEEYPTLFEQLHDRIIKPSYDTAVAWIRQKQREGDLDVDDPHAVAGVVVNALAQYQQEMELFGHLPTEATREDYLDQLVDMILSQAR